MKRRLASLYVLLLLIVPVLASARGLVPCGGEGEPVCDTCTLMQLVNNVIAWLVAILGTIAAIIIVYAGFKLVTAGGNGHAREDAKEMITNILIGYTIVLAGWLLIDTALKALLNEGTYGVWNEVQCFAPVTALDAPDYVSPDEEYIPTGVIGVGGGFSGGGSGGGASDSGGGVRGTGSGTCSVITDPNNACHPNRLTCFPDRNLASKICNLESRGGSTGVTSGTDLCQDGRSFSVGLWQINILANSRLLPGCQPGFFTSSNNRDQGSCLSRRTNSRGISYCQIRSCRITNESMYNTCVAAARNQANNTRAACSLMRSQGWSAWDTSWKACR